MRAFLCLNIHRTRGEHASNNHNVRVVIAFPYKSTTYSCFSTNVPHQKTGWRTLYNLFGLFNITNTRTSEHGRTCRPLKICSGWKPHSRAVAQFGNVRYLFALFAIFYACTTRTYPPPIYRIGGLFWCLVLFGVLMVILEWNIERLVCLNRANAYCLTFYQMLLFAPELLSRKAK